MTAPARAPKWFGLFLLAYAANFVYVMLLSISVFATNWGYLHFMYESKRPFPDEVRTYLEMAQQCLLTALDCVVFFLLLRQRRWGWILAVASACIFVTSRIAHLDIFIRKPATIGYDLPGWLWWMGVHAAFGLYLLRRDVRTIFQITPRTCKYTIIASAFLVLWYSVIGRFIYHI